MMNKLFLATSCAIAVGGCAIDSAEPDESTSVLEISKDPIDPIDPPTTQTTPPPEGPTVARVTSGELELAMRLLLAGQLITVDTTGTSPVRYGTPYRVCEDVNQPLREAEQNACFDSYSGAALNTCLQRALLDYPVLTECYTTAANHHSYIDFSSRAESSGATDLLFDVAPVYVEGWTSLHRVDINYLRTDPSRLLTAGFTADKTASISFPLTSNSPTLIVDDAPDVEMWNMSVGLRFTDINPGPAYTCSAGGIAPACTGGITNLVSARLSHATQRPSFSFGRNINNVPDWLVTQFVDIDTEIRSAAEGKLQEALLAPNVRAAVDQALTNLAIAHVRNTTHPTIVGFKRIKNTWYTSGQLVIEYEWY